MNSSIPTDSSFYCHFFRLHRFHSMLLPVMPLHSCCCCCCRSPMLDAWTRCENASFSLAFLPPGHVRYDTIKPNIKSNKSPFNSNEMKWNCFSRCVGMRAYRMRPILSHFMCPMAFKRKNKCGKSVLCCLADDLWCWFILMKWNYSKPVGIQRAYKASFILFHSLAHFFSWDILLRFNWIFPLMNHDRLF